MSRPKKDVRLYRVYLGIHDQQALAIALSLLWIAAGDVETELDALQLAKKFDLEEMVDRTIDANGRAHFTTSVFVFSDGPQGLDDPINAERVHKELADPQEDEIPF